MTEYFLQVDLIVDRKNQAEFEKSVKAFMSPHPEANGRAGFDRIDPLSTKDLVLAIRTKDPIGYAGYGHRQSSVRALCDERVSSVAPGVDAKNYFRYIHVWRMDDLKDLDLARLMTLSGDDDEYRHLDSLVTRETQNFVFRVPWLSELPKLLPAPQLNIVRVTRQLMTAELGTYLFSLGALIPTLEEAGLRTMGYFQNVTGLLNTVTEFWQTEDVTQTAIDKFVLSPAQITERVFQGSPIQEEILKAHAKAPKSHSYEVFETYLPPHLLQIDNINRKWDWAGPPDSSLSAQPPASMPSGVELGMS